jgi:hypothetical protein
LIACACALLLVASAGASAAATWGSASFLTDLGNPQTGSQIAVDASGNTTAVWMETLPNGLTDPNDPTSNTIPESQIVAATRPAGAASFGAPVVLSGDPTTQPNAPLISVDPAGDALVVWGQTGSGGTDIDAATRAAGGTFGAPALVSTTAAIGAPSVAYDAHGGRFSVAWTAAKSATLVGLEVRSTAAGRGPSAPRRNRRRARSSPRTATTSHRRSRAWRY